MMPKYEKRLPGLWLLYPYKDKFKTQHYLAAYISIKKFFNLAIPSETNKNYRIIISHDDHKIYNNNLPIDTSYKLTDINKKLVFQIYNQKFELNTLPSEANIDNFNSIVPELILILGILITILLYSLAISLLKHIRITKQVSFLLSVTKTISNEPDFDISVEKCIRKITSVFKLGHTQRISMS